MLGRRTARIGFLLVLGVGLASTGRSWAQSRPRGEGYRTPYALEFTIPRADLIADLEHSERGDPRAESEVPHRDWYAPGVRRRWGSWGPPQRHYPVPAGLDRWPVEARRERVIAVAARFLGYGYQHHHVPDWDPPRDWPWKETGVGHNGKGVDCSNFTAFVYNQGFGLKLSGDIHEQSRHRVAEAPSLRREVPLEWVPLPADYRDRVAALRTGDLLFIRHERDETVSHVVLWVGPIGKSSDGVPLILDSHGGGVVDSNGVPIPVGIHLRPYRENSWYHDRASHALRVFPDPR